MSSEVVTGKLKSYGVAIEYKMHGKQRNAHIQREIKERYAQKGKERRKQRETE